MVEKEEDAVKILSELREDVPLKSNLIDYFNGDYPHEGAPHPEKADDVMITLTAENGKVVLGYLTVGWLRRLLGEEV